MHLPRAVLASLVISITAVTATTVAAASTVNRNCTSASRQFAPLLWTLENLRYRPEVETTTFRLTNEANGYSAIIRCEAGNCSMPETSTPVDEDNAVSTNLTATLETNAWMSIASNQSWYCHDDTRADGRTPARTKFTAAASGTVMVQCQSPLGECISAHRATTIHGILLSPSAPWYYWSSQIKECETGNWSSFAAWPKEQFRFVAYQVRYWDIDIPCTPGVETPQPPPSNCPVNGVGLELDVMNFMWLSETDCKGWLEYRYPFNVTGDAGANGQAGWRREIHCDPAAWPTYWSFVRHMQTWVELVNVVRNSSGLETALESRVEQSWGCNIERGS